MSEEGSRFRVPLDNSECVERAVGESDLSPRGVLKWQAIRLREGETGVSVFRAIEHADEIKRSARDVKKQRYRGLAEVSVGQLRADGHDVVDRRGERSWDPPQTEPPRAHAEIEYASPPARVVVAQEQNEPEALTVARASEISFYRRVLKLFTYKYDPDPALETWGGSALGEC